MVQVFSDLHHFDLYYSFQLLFEKRLGGKLYRPIGYDWWQKGFWNLSDIEEVQIGYLCTVSKACRDMLQFNWVSRPATWARYATELLRVGNITVEDNHFLVEDLSKLTCQKAITLNQFKDTSFDIIISSVPQHFDCFEKLRQKYQPQAKHIFHMGPGNVEWEVPVGCKNVMAHTMPKHVPSGVNIILYSQEFDISVFRPYNGYLNLSETSQRIHSYVHFPESEQLWKAMNMNWSYFLIGKTLGSLGETIVETKQLAGLIAQSGWTWHVKPGGESYGHILHNTYACGRPAIINMQDFKSKRGGKLLEDMVTCVDVTNCTPAELRNKLYKAADMHSQMCENAYNRFKEVVNFDEEEKDLRNFLENLQ